MTQDRKDGSSSELRKTKRELAACKRQLKEALAFNERIRSAVGYDELKGWQPQESIQRQYGWVYAWLYPLSSYMSENLNKPLTVEVRDKIHDIVTAIIAQLTISGKYGVDFPHESRGVDVAQFMKKQNNSFQRIYYPCAICGEDRITHECHIIPRSEGGQYHLDNFVILCPLHHHLFDHARLSKTEWAELSSALVGKMESAIVYANQVRLPKIQSFWLENEESSN